ncbi:MAG: outer membrane lipoprotein-sorting protein [Ignavibacteria bacterium]|nr:outer membrane lipoprotein-sorting protein [Ignavibacteria bacterium]
MKNPELSDIMSARVPPLATLFLISTLSTAQTPQEIIKKAEDTLRGDTSRGTFEMTVVTPEFTRTLRMESWWIGEKKSLITIKAPKKEEGNKWLKIGNEMWNYLKSTETTIKIPPSMMLQSWNGSDFTNDDLVRESSMSEDYDADIVAEEEAAGEMCWKFRLLPKPEAAVVWGKLYVWVRQKDILPSIVEYYDEKGVLIRYMAYSSVKTMGGRTIPTIWSMHNKIKQGNRTEFIVLDIEFDIAIPDRVFSFRELERGN